MEYLTTKQAAEKLGVTESRIRQLIAEGRLKSEKLGHINVILEKDLAKIAPRPIGRPKKEKSELQKKQD